ncbi:MAG: hypothetical protein HYY76_11185 [Acidobacteria bacterium]|nr:hypothetical protein [Acidobacteriota bacterium]
MRRAVLGFASFLVSAAPALAQSAYVAGGIGADIFRPARVEARGADDLTLGGEAVALSVRVGTAVTDRWGVELELTRAGETEREMRRGVPIPVLTGRAIEAGVLLIPELAVPLFESTVRLARRHTTLDAVAWVAQTISGRVDLVYLGGVAFIRSTGEMEFEIRRRPDAAPIVVPPRTRTTTYDAGPVAGVEARVALTGRTTLIPGLRLHGVGGDTAGAWLLRPSVAVGWRF